MATCLQCERPTVAKGLCTGHYQQMKRGVPFAPLRRRGLSDQERIRNLSHVDEAGCWLRDGYATPDGYGRSGRGVGAHRWAYEAFVGPIPESLSIDHLCNVPRCVNPAHLQVVPINVWRGWRLCRACNRQGQARARVQGYQ
jgi:HNH endonuclease